MSITSLTLIDLFRNMSNAFIGTIGDMYGETTENDILDDAESGKSGGDKTIRVLMKENRYMYLALLVLLVLIVGNLFFTGSGET